MSNSLIPKMAEMLHPHAKAIIDEVASKQPEQVSGLWQVAGLLGDISSQFYIAKFYPQTMPSVMQAYLKKLVAVTELMEADEPPNSAILQGMLLDLITEQRMTEVRFEGMPAEVVEVLVIAAMGFDPDTKRINVIDYVAANGGVVPVDNDTAAVAKAVGLNIDALSMVPGNETKH